MICHKLNFVVGWLKTWFTTMRMGEKWGFIFSCDNLFFDFVTIDYIVELDISHLLNYYNDHMRLVALDMTYTQVCPLANSFHDYYFFIHFNLKNNNNNFLNHLKITILKVVVWT